MCLCAVRLLQPGNGEKTYYIGEKQELQPYGQWLLLCCLSQISAASKTILSKNYGRHLFANTIREIHEK